MLLQVSMLYIFAGFFLDGRWFCRELHPAMESERRKAKGDAKRLSVQLDP
jgi:hypothetical protein